MNGCGQLNISLLQDFKWDMTLLFKYRSFLKADIWLLIKAKLSSKCSI